MLGVVVGDGPAAGRPNRYVDLTKLPVVAPVMRLLTHSPWPLLVLKLLVVAAFLTVIVAGLFGTSDAKRNLATILTWNLWWVLVIISVIFVGSAWCSVCPWNSLANWLVKWRLWRRPAAAPGLNLRPPRALRRLWVALAMLVGLTWLELAWGATENPMLTASLALIMVLLAVTCMLVFERGAFCRYYCPVGRTIGFYSQLAPVELRPVDADVCARCTTLDCYHGTELVEPCPTRLTMGRFAQNTYCTSCGNCVIGCPHHNVAWRLRSLAREARVDARPHWDEAWFMVSLWAITTFHGVSMSLYWEDGVEALGRALNESGRLTVSFTLGMVAAVGLLVLAYVLFVALARRISSSTVPFGRWFSVIAFTTLPIAFSYHVAHNLSHLARETASLGKVLADPLGLTAPLGPTAPLGASDPLGLGAVAAAPMTMPGGDLGLLIPEQLLFAMQVGIILVGFWLTLQVLRHRGHELLGDGVVGGSWRLLPIVMFAGAAAGVNLLLLTQVMVMRM
jgi:ferredoxin